MSCGLGTQSRSRKIDVAPQGTGTVCPSPRIESIICDTKKVCPVNCMVSNWTYSTCSVECGGGTQNITRTVTTAQVGTGEACPTLSSSQSCNNAVNTFIYIYIYIYYNNCYL